jgi:phosphogluconate dehydratase
MARCAGIALLPEDFAEIADVVPLLARIYPNGLADVNHFHAAGGMAWLVGELLAAGLVHDDVETVAGTGLAHYASEPQLINGGLVWQDGPRRSLNDRILRPHTDPFAATGGLQRLVGNLGEGIVKTSAVAAERHVIEAPARVFHSQDAVKAAFRDGTLDGDCVVVVRFQGPRANGMPELHTLTPILSVLQDRGHRVALVTDGRMSGASGKVPAAIHVTPEAAEGGPLARLVDGDMIRLDAVAGRLEVLDPAALARPPATPDLRANDVGCGRELFAALRHRAGPATAGASILF